MILNIITFSVCLLMLIIFRKFERSSLKMAKLRRYSSRLFDEFKKLAETESRKFSDATIEMDILIKKSNLLTKNLSSSINEIENRLKGLNVEKTNLVNVEDNLQVISQSAKDVNKQIEFIARSKDSFSKLTDNMSAIDKELSEVKRTSSNMINSFNQNIKETSGELLSQFNDQIEQLKWELIDRDEKILSKSEQKITEQAENFERSISEMERNLSDTGEILLQDFKNKIEGVAKSVEGASNLENQLEILKINFSEIENRAFTEIYDKLGIVETDVEESKQKIVDSFEQDVSELYTKLGVLQSDVSENKYKIIKEFKIEMAGVYDNLSDIKKDVDESSEELGRTLENVETNINESKGQLIKTFEQEVDKVRNELDNLSIHSISKRDEIVNASRQEAEAIMGKIEGFEVKFVEFEKRISDRTMELKKELVDYEENSEVFSRIELMKNETSSSIEKLNDMLITSREEAKSLERFFEDVEQIKELQKSFEREIRSYQDKKGRLTEVEREIRGLKEISDIAINKANDLHDDVLNLDGVSSRIEVLSTSYTKLESRIKELQEYEDVISVNLENINKSDIMLKEIENKIDSYRKVIEKAEKRADKVNKNLHDFEESTLILKSRENEIKDVREKFDELDGLSSHMETRINQINAMFKKVEDIRGEIDITDHRLQEMYSETDRRMKQFADFIQAVDNNNPILKQVNEKAAPIRNVNENVVQTVRELSDKGWSSDEISKKMMMDENTVRLIINTTSI